MFTGNVEFAGETCIASSVAAAMLTVMVVPAVKPPVLAEIVAEPLVKPVATPAELTDTSLELLDNQLTDGVRFCVEPSE